jgi:MFS family permease
MLALAWFAYSYFGLGAYVSAAVLPRMQDDLGFSASAGGLVLGSWPIAYVVGAGMAGFLNDTLGSRRSVALGIVGMTVSAMLTATAQTLASLVVAGLVFGLGGSLISTGTPKVVGDWFSEGPARTRASAFYVTGPPFGATVMLALANSVLIPWLGSWRGLAWFVAGVGAAVLTIWLACALDVAPGSDERASGPRTAVILRSAQVWTVVLAGIGSFAIAHGFTRWLPTILESRGASADEAGFVAAGATMVQICGMLTIPRIANVIGRRKPVVLAAQVVVVALLLASASSYSTSGLAVFVWIETLVAASLLPLLMSSLIDLPVLRGGGVGAASGVYFTVGQTAGFGAPTVVGMLKGVTGSYTAGIVFLAGVVLACMVPAALMPESAAMTSSRALPVADPSVG